VSGAKFKPLEAAKNKAPIKWKAPLEPLEVEKPKKKKGFGCIRY
jgi:hypothetical protein